ncbi:DEAD-box ATP-dependent RNA helicase 36 [Phytophthora cinnamomi]|uniref:DEAD-box ATP-dependent RNA helicase 36 n=1 Tax=Phytophthora cinnamomi TaxID=4785 RepID=UPI003559A1B5|nr:DEAD-box ATP-dependent RNA helicase 36 [Phytophthora cinnamomi]
MDVQLADADSRVSKLAHEMYQLLEKENMEWMVEREPKKIVSYLTDALAPDQFRRTVKNELARESNKPLTKNVVAFMVAHQLQGVCALGAPSKSQGSIYGQTAR